MPRTAAAGQDNKYVVILVRNEGPRLDQDNMYVVILVLVLVQMRYPCTKRGGRGRRVRARARDLCLTRIWSRCRSRCMKPCLCMRRIARKSCRAAARACRRNTQRARPPRHGMDHARGGDGGPASAAWTQARMRLFENESNETERKKNSCHPVSAEQITQFLRRPRPHAWRRRVSAGCCCARDQKLRRTSSNSITGPSTLRWPSGCQPLSGV